MKSDMKRLIVLLALLLVCVAPVVGLSLDFQNSGDFTAQITGTGTWVQSATGGNNYMNIGIGKYVQNAVPSQTTYIAFTMLGNANSIFGITLKDSTGVILTSFTSDVTDYSTTARYEIKMAGGKAYWYRDGSLKATSVVLAQNPSYVNINVGANGAMQIDDLVYGDTESKYIFDAPETGYFIKKDMVNPAAYGLYNSAGALVNSNYMFARYGRGNNAIPPSALASENVVLINYATQQIYATHGTGTKYSEQFNWNIYEALVNSSAPCGQYATTIAGTGKISNLIMYLGNGATVAWDKDTYSVGDTGVVVSYISSGGYWDPVTYDYAIDIQDIYGTVKQSTPITTQTGSITVTWTDSDSLGVWYAIMKATPKSGGTTIWMNYDWAELQAYIVFSGYVMNAENGTVINAAYVNVTQSNVTLQSQSLASGAWNSSNSWVGGSSFNITTMKTGYTTDVRLISPLASKSIFLNISLVPLPPTNVSVSVGGVVRDNVYGNPIQNATVSGVNTTATATNLTNIAGYYRVDNMLNPDVVNMSAAKTGYMNDTVSGFLDASITTSFTRRDLVLDPVFSLTVNIIDSSTHMPIPVVMVLDSLGNNQTTTVGQYVESYPYSTVVLYLSSSGYIPKSVSYIMDSDRVETVEMSEAVEIPGVQPQSYPKYVTFHIKDGSMFGAPLAEVGINVTGISTSSGSWDWISQLIGLPLNEVPINTEHMYQSTDSLGRATFYVIPTTKYNITFTKVGYTIPPMILVPQDDDYIITATSATSPFYRNGVDEISAINISVSSTLYNESWAFLNFTYYDSTGHTTGGTVRVLQKSDTAWTADSVMATWPVTSSSFSNSTVVVHVQQVSGYIDANITHSDFGNIQRSYPYAFNSVPVQFLGFEQDITLIVALGIMLLTMMLGGAAHGRVLLVIVSMEGWVMYTMHWFQSLFDRGVPETAFVSAIVFMFIIGILANILMRKKRGL